MGGTSDREQGCFVVERCRYPGGAQAVAEKAGLEVECRDLWKRP